MNDSLASKPHWDPPSSSRCTTKLLCTPPRSSWPMTCHDRHRTTWRIACLGRSDRELLDSKTNHPLQTHTHNKNWTSRNIRSLVGECWCPQECHHYWMGPRDFTPRSCHIGAGAAKHESCHWGMLEGCGLALCITTHSKRSDVCPGSE